MIRITIESDELTAEAITDLLAVPRQLRKIHTKLTLIGDKIMSLETEFTALAGAFTTLSTEIDREIQQVLDAIAAGSDATATVEDARTRINALTASMNEKVAALQADNPPEPPPA